MYNYINHEESIDIENVLDGTTKVKFIDNQELYVEIYKKTIQKELEFDVVFFHPHQDELVSLQVGKEFIDINGGLLLSVVDESSPDTRSITAFHNGKKYDADPNRIFSESGIRTVCGIGDDEVVKIFNSYAKYITDVLDKYSYIVALHNNKDCEGDESFSIKNYLPRGDSFSETSNYYYNPKNGTANFFITNDDETFEKAKEQDFNVVLYKFTQESLDKGYLSSYATNKNIRYTNIEAKRGSHSEQTEMLNMLNTVLSKKNT